MVRGLAEDQLQVAVVIEVHSDRGGGSLRGDPPGLFGRHEHRVSLGRHDCTVGVGLGRTVVVEVGQAHRAALIVGPERRGGPLDGAVVLERDEPIVHRAGLEPSDDLGPAIVVDVPHRGRHLAVHRRVERGELLPRRAVEDHDPAAGDHDDIRRVTQVDDPVVVVVGEVDHQRRGDRLGALPRPLDLRVIAGVLDASAACRRRVGDLQRGADRTVGDVGGHGDVELHAGGGVVEPR